MNSKVIVTADQNGNVIRQSKNPELGYVRLVQDRITINNKGWVNKKTFSALIKGSIEDLKAMGLDKISTMPGNIVVVESTTPFNEAMPNRDLKIAGDTGVILCTKDGEPIYRTTIYDASGCMQDELIPHANGDAIRTKIATKKQEVVSVEDVDEDEEQVEEISQHKLSFDELDNDNEFESVSDEIEEDVEEYDEDLEFDL